MANELVPEQVLLGARVPSSQQQQRRTPVAHDRPIANPPPTGSGSRTGTRRAL